MNFRLTVPAEISDSRLFGKFGVAAYRSCGADLRKRIDHVDEFDIISGSDHSLRHHNDQSEQHGFV